MKSPILILFTYLYLINPIGVFSQTGNNLKSISFIDYGPVAFDSFWRLPDIEFKEHPLISLSSKVSTSPQQSFYFTQYFRTDIPIGGNHTLSLRLPYHYFNVKPDKAQDLNMSNNSGTEFGDIDIIFNISFLKNILDQNPNNKMSIYFTGEMHTAPTSRANRQFIDLLKLLGSVNIVYSITENNSHSLNSVLSIGSGGWDDLTPPYQKHAIKISSKFNFKLNFKNNQGISLFFGETYIYAEGENNKGLYLSSGLSYWKTDGIQIGLSFGQINYPKPFTVRQYEFTASVPINWKK